MIPDYIVHYYYTDSIPFQNLSDLDDAERGKVIAHLNDRHARKEIGRAFPEWYMPQRLEAERNLRNSFISKGGKPERTSPHYFTLGFSPLFEKLYSNKAAKEIFKVDHFSPDELCFCLNDSLWTMAESKDPQQKFNCRWFEGQVYSYAEAAEILTGLRVDVENEESLRENKIAFVEALVWGDAKITARKF